MSSFSKFIEIDAPDRRVWEVLSDIGTIAEWDPGVVNSYTTSRARRGMDATRHCELRGDKYLDEIVTDWKTRKKLTTRVIETNLPFEEAETQFHLKPTEEQTSVGVRTEYTLKYGAIGRLLDKLYFRRKYEDAIETLLIGLKEYCEADKKYDF